MYDAMETSQNSRENPHLKNRAAMVGEDPQEQEEVRKTGHAGGIMRWGGSL
jgi:hypothetical protein